MQRKRIVIEGIVQGVGFRPFVYQLALRSGVDGWVLNDSSGVTVEVEGEGASLASFVAALQSELPPLASISRCEIIHIPPRGERGFSIRSSAGDGPKTAQIAPDSWVCPDCLAELSDPLDRRYRYPFINCTNCGPRYTIVTGIPYDRPNTTMAPFPMCPACSAEYRDPASRRFHAQPNACPVCGPRLQLKNGAGDGIAGEPLAESVALLQGGAILAVKGLGGYHLVVDAANDRAVSELRRRKARDEKPFALMARSLEDAARLADFDPLEEWLLTGSERPIVLLRKKPGHTLSPLIAPGNGYFGIMLPYTPLHFLLLEEFPALVMTSANLSDEPIASGDGEAETRLKGIADAYLSHDREIFTGTDDSIARILAGRALLLRRSRGYVPRGIALAAPQVQVLALGAEIKSAVCFTRGDRAFLSQHIGDLKNPEVFASFERTIAHLGTILELQPAIVAHDLHPDYYSSRYAEGLGGVRLVAVQHHHAHLVSCLAENGFGGTAIGVIFDGIGYGADGTLWGGEFLVGGADGYRRAGHFVPLAMPGGDAATAEPLRMAVSALQHAYGADLPSLPVLDGISPRDLKIYLQMIEKGINAPLTSSCGRLFDAVAALVGVRLRVSYEGQAALELEMAIGDTVDNGIYPSPLGGAGDRILVDPAPLIRGIVDDLMAGVAVSRISARFHNTLAAVISAVCLLIRQESGLSCVALSGGVFQNRYLTEKTISRLEKGEFTVLTHSLVPPNDGGIALGQAVVAGRSAS
ncbi:hydrogenase maturation protein, carbamoyltransferase HypF [Desulfuromonas soudanensis]|uniref:Carbamoyltransferase n=1 Tax=Desulfuromonas soudanensis TaxID=1603606 RepID=A0A0M5IU61_9BACT|nr:carbamoyltransferase HypF [Desulfuromonas soudanensis]ALC17068.1 hydrogenase maturation protein, carbamoyltransferase HypF [Desulfuromonas soudanensis]